MKATAVKEAENFQPITLTMQIESADELVAFQEMFGADASIPMLLKNCADISEEQCIALGKAMYVVSLELEKV